MAYKTNSKGSLSKIDNKFPQFPGHCRNSSFLSAEPFKNTHLQQKGVDFQVGSQLAIANDLDRKSCLNSKMSQFVCQNHQISSNQIFEDT